jgi:ferredoxin
VIVSKQKPMATLLEDLKGDEALFVLGCGGCAQGSGTGGPAEVAAMVTALRDAGKSVVGDLMVDFLCNKALVGTRLARKVAVLGRVDALVVMTCGIGVQAVARMVDRPVRAALDTVYLGGFQGSWPSEERCLECGDCVLSYTGGICPVTACAKSLVNGICGGSKDKMCEVAPTKPCGWVQIFERCQERGQLARLEQFLAARDYRKQQAFPEELRTTVRWALEVEERAAPAAASAVAPAAQPAPAGGSPAR